MSTVEREAWDLVGSRLEDDRPLVPARSAARVEDIQKCGRTPLGLARAEEGTAPSSTVQSRIFVHHTTFQIKVGKIGKNGVGSEVEIVSFMQDNDHLGPLPFNTDIPIQHDVVLLKTIKRQYMDEKAAARPVPAPTQPTNLSILGINGDSRPVPIELLHYYPPTINQSSLDAAVKDLRPDYISLSSGQGFTAELVDHVIQPSNADDSPLICYRISTSPGLSGSPVCPKDTTGVYGLHVGASTAAGQITAQTINGGISFGSKDFKKFIRRALLPMMSTEVRQAWAEFAGPQGQGEDDIPLGVQGPTPLLESKMSGKVASPRYIWLE
ncbi:hypothetical protein FN846DRAFT_922643 [Sphaerosporella brunnea]|uniref:Uncharacterized protein n=1 Tax=Sphaerosporella brunnea TaxID=1250544 RepID=A0A5J5EJ39_9PEZI|nr:hypothetical protein FN846DRAFT_922643 [Sphaerosporella brunnea]